MFIKSVCLLNCMFIKMYVYSIRKFGILKNRDLGNRDFEKTGFGSSKWKLQVGSGGLPEAKVGFRVDETLVWHTPADPADPPNPPEVV